MAALAAVGRSWARLSQEKWCWPSRAAFARACLMPSNPKDRFKADRDATVLGCALGPQLAASLGQTGKRSSHALQNVLPSTHLRLRESRIRTHQSVSVVQYSLQQKATGSNPLAARSFQQGVTEYLSLVLARYPPLPFTLHLSFSIFPSLSLSFSSFVLHEILLRQDRLGSNPGEVQHAVGNYHTVCAATWLCVSSAILTFKIRRHNCLA